MLQIPSYRQNLLRSAIIHTPNGFPPPLPTKWGFSSFVIALMKILLPRRPSLTSQTILSQEIGPFQQHRQLLTTYCIVGPSFELLLEKA